MQNSELHNQREHARRKALQKRTARSRPAAAAESDGDQRHIEACLHSLFRSAPIGIGVLADRVLLEVNDRLCEMVGYTTEELVGHNARILYRSDEDYEHVGSEQYAQIRERGIGAVETRWRRKDGALIEVLLSSTPLDANDLSQGVTFTALDISERKRTEDELRSIFELSLDMVCIADIRTSTFVKVNPAFERILGYRCEDIVGQSFLDFIHPDDVEATRAVVAEKLQAGESVVNFKNRYRCADGTYRWLSWTSHPKPEQGLTYAIARNITELKQADDIVRESEAILNETGMIARIGGWKHDLTTGQAVWTRALYDIFEIESGPPPGVEEHPEYYPPQDRRILAEAYQRALEQGTPFDVELQARTAKGRPLWCRVIGRPVMRDGICVEMRGTFQEITERKEAELALRASERRYRGIVEDQTEFICRFTPTGEVTFANEALCRFYGVPSETLFGKDFTAFVPLEEHEALWHRLRALTPEQPTETHENEGVLPSGQTFWGRWTNRAIFDDTGRLVEYQAVGSDITEHKRAEQALEMFHFSTDQAPEPILWLERDGRVCYANQKACESLGYTREELMQLRLWDITPGSSPEHLAQQWSQYEKTALGTQHFQTWHRRKDGSVFPVDISTRHIWFGDVELHVSFSRDMTERQATEAALRESETRFRELAEMLPQIVFELDAAGHFRFVNRVGLRNLGYTREELADLDILTLFVPEDRERIAAGFCKRLHDEPVADREYQALRKDGSTFPVLLYASPIFQDSQPVGLRGIGLDITERKKAERERQARLHHLENMERINATIREATDPEQMMSKVIETVYSIFDCDRVWLLYPCDPDAASFRIPVEFTRAEYPGAHALGVDLEMNPARAQDQRDALASKDPLRIIVGTEHPVPSDIAEEFGVQSQLVTAVYPRVGKPWLFGLHQCSHPRVWTTEEQRLFKEIGHRIADGLSSLLSLRDLRESETRFRDLAELLPQTVFEIDLEGRFAFVSRLAFETFGYSPEELSCLSAADFFLPEERERVQRNLRKRIQGDTFWDHQYTALRKDGTTFPSLVYSTPIIRHGVAVGLRGILVDITERQCAEQALQESKATLESILESSPNAITVLDLEGRITDCNQATLEMYGSATKDEVLGRSGFDFVTETDRPRTREYLKTVLAQGLIKNAEVTLLKKDGREFPAEVSVSVMSDSGGQPIGLVAAMADITERKRAEQALRESEQKYRSVVEDSPGLICTFRPDGELTFVNDAYCQYFGRPREELLGKPFSVLIPDEHREQAMADIASLTPDAPVQTHEHRVVVSRGEVRWNRWTNRAIFDEAGRITAYQAFGEDITERKRLEQALEKRILALTCPMSETEDVEFEELFDLGEIQELQDLFSEATGVASIITYPDGTPITKPSNFCRLCEEIIRGTNQGLRNCYYSDSVIGRHRPDGPIIQHCLSGGLWDAGASITAGGRHVANWLIGQVRDDTQDEEKMLEYARAIGADPEDFRKAFREVPTMSRDQFEDIASALFVIARQLSTTAYQNVQQARFIADRKRAQEALANERNLLRTLIDNLPDSTYIKDRDGRFLLCSRQTVRAAGVQKAEQVIGKSDFDFYPPEIAARFFEEEQELMHSGIPLLNVERCVDDAVTGQKVWDLTTKVPLRDGEGRIVGLVGISKNITEHKRSQEALRESLQTSSDIVASIPSGLLLYKYTPPDTLTLIDTNPAATHLLGVDLHQYIGWDFDVLWPRARKAGLTDAYLDVMRTGKMFINEDTAYEDDKISGVFTTRVFRIPGNRLCAVFENVTERRRADLALQESERKLATLMANLPGMAYRCLVDEEWTMLFVSEGCRDLTGYHSEDVIGNHTVSYNDIIHPDDRQKVQEAIAQALLALQSFEIEYRIHTAQGQEKWVWERGRAVGHLQESNASILEGFILDISERRHVEEKLLAYQKKLKSLASELSLTEERERRRVAVGLHDQACQNLVLSKMKLQGLRPSLLSGQTEAVETVCQTLTETIESIRELTFDLSSPILYKFGLAAALEELLKDKLRAGPGIQCRFSDDGRPKPLSQDVLVLLFQSVRELVINVLKHAQAHKVTLDIRRDSDSIYVVLSDDGIGFDVDEVLSFPSQRRSVGLFNILERLDYIGGRLDIASSPGHGSRFTLVAPLRTEVSLAKESDDGTENSAC